MEHDWFILRQYAHDRLEEARAAARSRTLIRAVGPPRRAWYVLGTGLVRLGGWVLARATQPSAELSPALADLRVAPRSSWRKAL